MKEFGASDKNELVFDDPALNHDDTLRYIITDLAEEMNFVSQSDGHEASRILVIYKEAPAEVPSYLHPFVPA